ncbi:MAG: class I SAM-dependent methyltransferase [Desulfofustis sp.]|nr:class I SAM-dependent methyltransferase [Desulfofustis sp.]
MDIKQLVSIRIVSQRQEDLTRTEELIGKLDLPKPTVETGATRFFLAYRNDRLELFDSTLQDSAHPLSVDFLAGPSYYRFLNDRRINQPLGKAVGIRKGIRPTVCDVTAGCGEDGFVLACLGCRVVLIERSPIVWALLDDGLRRAAAHPQIGKLVAERISLYLSDAEQFLAATDVTFDTVYLDPMYPSPKKSALNKLKMRLLRAIVGDDLDSGKLIGAAKKALPARIAVKRPLRAPTLTPARPHFSVAGKSSRFDVYLPPYLW